MPIAQLLSPDPDYASHTARAEAAAAIYCGALARHGVELVAAPWPTAEPAAPSIALLAWGYHLKPVAWGALLARWDPAVPLLNPAATLMWNTDKRYLAEIAGMGISAVPTRFVDRADAAAVEAARAAFGVDEIVSKPRLSGGAHDTHRLRPGDPAPGTADAMLQPFLPAVSGEGELSLIYLGGGFSHAVRKVAAQGDFRVQREHGGAYTVFDPPAEALALAQAALAAAPAPPAYARADLIRLPGGGLAVIELELIEPDLYLDLVPGAHAAFGAALAPLLTGKRAAAG